LWVHNIPVDCEWCKFLCITHNLSNCEIKALLVMIALIDLLIINITLTDYPYWSVGDKDYCYWLVVMITLIDRLVENITPTDYFFLIGCQWR